MDIPPGTTLTTEQSESLGKEILGALIAVRQRRGAVLAHSTIQGCIGSLFAAAGAAVHYEVPYSRGQWAPKRFVFDVVIEVSKQTLVVEVKDFITARDLGQVYGYCKALELEGDSAKVFLGTDVLHLELLTRERGVISHQVRDMMAALKLGLIFADTGFLIRCDNY